MKGRETFLETKIEIDFADKHYDAYVEIEIIDYGPTYTIENYYLLDVAEWDKDGNETFVQDFDTLPEAFLEVIDRLIPEATEQELVGDYYAPVSC